MYKIKAFSEKVGLSVRSLRHYDKIGLLVPEHINRHTGYRYYGDKNFSTVQKILFFKELGFSLAEIKILVNNDLIDQYDALCIQRNLLELKKQRLGEMVEYIDELLIAKNYGAKNMNDQLKNTMNNSQFENKKAAYLEEAKKRWGNTKSFKQSQQRMSRYNQDELAKINLMQISIFQQLAKLMYLGAEDQQVQELIHSARMLINDYWYDCDEQRYVALGEMYENDPKFKTNIDQYGDGLAAFINQAIGIYAA